MCNIMRRFVGLLCLTSLVGVGAFSSSSPTTTFKHGRFETSLAYGPGAAELMAALLVAGSAAAAYQEYRTDKFHAVKEFTKTHREQLTEEIESFQETIQSFQDSLDNKDANGLAVATKQEPAPVKETVDKAEQVAETVATPPAVETPKSDPKPKRTKVVDPPKPEAVALIKSTPKPVARTASDSLTELVKQVGKTVEQNKEMEDLVKSRRQQQAKQQMEAQDSETQAVVTVLTEENPPKKSSLLRKAWRVTKKVVAPWRKWENIS